jgi:uncharacterized protein YfaS (alpha-2-macroglobulin family)
MNSKLGAIATAIALAACGGKTEEKRGPTAEVVAGDAGAAPIAKEGPPKPAPVTAKQLAPVIRERAVSGIVPRAVVIELATAVGDKDAIGETSADTRIAVTPDAPGEVKVTGPSTLTFVPEKPFAFNTRYKFEVLAIQTRSGPVTPAEGEHWVREFATPKFAALKWSTVDEDATKHKFRSNLVFSGAVLPNRAKPFITFTIEGKPTANVAFNPTPDPNVIQAVISDPRIVLGAHVAVAIKKGLPAEADAKADSATFEHIVSDSKGVDIKGAVVQEGANGFYIEVVCNDRAAPSGGRSFYSEQAHVDFYDLSERCQLPDDAMKRITIEPAAGKTYMTGGRAGFRIFGDFKRGEYSVKIPSGLVSVDGGVVLADFEDSFTVPARKPRLSFAASGRYLPRTAWNNLGIKHLNVDEVNLFVRQVPPEDLPFWLSNDGSETADERTSDLILKKTLRLHADADAGATTWLDVGSLLPATTKGVLEIKLQGVDANATSRLMLTNMSLVAKKSTPPKEPWNHQVLVWALDIDSGATLGGVDVTMVKKSGKPVARCTTDGDKGCVLAAAPGDDPDQGEPMALIARKGDDLTYIRYKDLKADVGESAVSGEPYQSESPYRAAIWSDRGVYRPGDTAHVVAVLRTGSDVAPEAALPVDVKLVDPRSKVVRKQALKTNPAGLITVDYAFPAFADTGHYQVEIGIADKTVASYGMQVEEFVPERMKVTAAADKPSYLIGDEVQFHIGAQYLFGGSAAGSSADVTCTVEPARFEPKQNSELTYGVEPKGKAIPLGDTKGELDEAGTATVTCPDLDSASGFKQTGTLTAQVAVLEAGSGRSTQKAARTTIHPEKFYLGVKANTQRAASGKTFTVSGLVVDWGGAPAPGAAKQVDVELLHYESEYGYSYEERGGDDEESYAKYLHPVPEGRIKAAVDGGKFTFDVTPGDANIGYIVRVTAGKAVTELTLDGEFPYEYRYGDSSGRMDQTPRPSKPTALALEVPKEIQLGQAVPIKLLAPYRGRILFTVETDRVIASEWREVSSGQVEWSWKPTGFAPNVYFSAFLVKDPHAESKDAYLPGRAFGVAGARMLPTEYTQDLKLDVPKDIRSSSALTVKLDVGASDGPTFATVAVVDEGILQLTDFKSPDPLAALLAKRALGVETYETIGWTLLHAPAGPSSATGGGDDEESSGGGGKADKGRVQPVKPVALFSGVVAVDASGKATIPFQIPAYRGELRVMAVAANGKRIGHADAHVTVKDPLVVQVTFPRFVTQGDEAQIPVFLTNLSGGPLDVSVALAGDLLPVPGMTQPKNAPAPLVFLGKDSGSLKIADGKSETVVFQARANLPVGAAKLRVVARGKGPTGSFESKDEVDVPFEPAGPKERIVQKLKVGAGTTDVAPLLKGWTPTSEASTFWLTANPYGEAFDHLKYLVHYPYGCIEQTTSSTRPLLYIANLVEQVDPKLAEARIEDMVLAGINRVLSMQTPSGGLGYWPGDTEALEWGTAYATHMLLDAKKLNYPVPEDRLDNILTWIENRAASYERGETPEHRAYHYDDKSEAYLHYVLALAGRGKKARVQKLIDGIPASAGGELAENRYMLMAALYIAGDRRYEGELRKPDTSPIVKDRSRSYSFYSDRRRRGFMLSTYFDLFGRDPAGETLAQRVAESLTGQPAYYYNTQELVWGVTGLGKWAGTAARDFKPGQLTADGQTLTPRAAKHQTTEQNWALVRASEYKSLTLNVPEKSEGSLYLVVSSEGVREKPTVTYGGNGLSVARSYRSLAGDAVNLTDGSINLGDLIFVELDIENTSDENIQNIALVDRLPAGFEIENPRLGRATTAEWIEKDSQWDVDYLNIRDDRIEAFGRLGRGDKKTVVYTVRAVTSGKFTAPAVDAEAMYDPTLWAREQGKPVVIGGPWAGKLL